MQSKSLLIAIAAFAVTATGAQAYIGTEQLSRAGFTSHQIEAFSEARELKAKGQVEKARDVLLEAGVDEKKLNTLRKVSHDTHHKLYLSIKHDDYESFKTAVAGTPLDDIITTEIDFTQFRQAHKLQQEGELDEAKAIFTDLGLPTLEKNFVHKSHGHQNWLELTDEQRDALSVARQSNDQETVQAILEEAGIV